MRISWSDPEPDLRLPGRDGELEAAALHLHLASVDHAAVAAAEEITGVNDRPLPLGCLVDGDDAPVPAREDDEAVGFEEGALLRSVHGIVEGDHGDDIGPAPCLVPAIEIPRVSTGALVVVGIDERDPAVPAEDIDIGEKLVLRIEHLPAEAVIVRDVVGYGEGDGTVRRERLAVCRRVDQLPQGPGR